MVQQPEKWLPVIWQNPGVAVQVGKSAIPKKVDPKKTFNMDGTLAKILEKYASIHKYDIGTV